MAFTKRDLADRRRYQLKQLRDPKAPYSKKTYYQGYKEAGGTLTYAQAIKGTKTTTKKRKGC
jgi:hypothetical protein